MNPDLDDKGFGELSSAGKACILFISEWGESSKRFATIYGSIADKHKDAEFAIIDSDSYDEIADKYEVQSVPTVLYFSGGELVGRTDAIQNEEEFHKAYSEFFGG